MGDPAAMRILSVALCFALLAPAAARAGAASSGDEGEFRRWAVTTRIFSETKKQKEEDDTSVPRGIINDQLSFAFTPWLAAVGVFDYTALDLIGEESDPVNRGKLLAEASLVSVAGMAQVRFFPRSRWRPHVAVGGGVSRPYVEFVPSALRRSEKTLEDFFKQLNPAVKSMEVHIEQEADFEDSFPFLVEVGLEWFVTPRLALNVAYRQAQTRLKGKAHSVVRGRAFLDTDANGTVETVVELDPATNPDLTSEEEIFDKSKQEEIGFGISIYF